MLESRQNRASFLPSMQPPCQVFVTTRNEKREDPTLYLPLKTCQITVTHDKCHAYSRSKPEVPRSSRQFSIKFPIIHPN